MKSELLMHLLFFIKNLDKLILLLIIFACETVVYSQSNNSVYISFEKGCLSNYGLAGLGGNDTLCFNDDILELLKSNDFKSIKTNNIGCLESVISADSSEQYLFTYKNDNLHIEEAYFLFPQKLFRKRVFSYDKKGRLKHIKYTYNLCCEKQSPIPPDDVYYQYDTNGYLKFVLITISSKKNKGNDYSDSGTPIRKNKNFTKLYEINYLSDKVVISSYSLDGKSLNKIKSRDFNMIISETENVIKYYVRTEKVNFDHLKQSFQQIIFPAYYFMLWGNDWNKGTQI